MPRPTLAKLRTQTGDLLGGPALSRSSFSTARSAASLGLRVGRRQQGRAADIEEVPAYPQQHQRAGEGRKAGAGHGRQNMASQDDHAGQHHRARAEPRDQAPRKEARDEHAQHMKLDDGRGVG